MIVQLHIRVPSEGKHCKILTDDSDSPCWRRLDLAFHAGDLSGCFVTVVPPLLSPAKPGVPFTSS